MNSEEKLILELEELKQEYNSLKVSYEKDIAERKKAEDEILRHSNELATLLKISREFATTLDLEKLLQMICDRVIELSELNTSAIYLLNGESIRLWATSPSLPPEFPDVLREALLTDHPHIRESISTGISKFLSDTKTADLTPAEQAVCELRNLRSVLYLPLHVGKRSLGVLIVGSEELLRLSDDEINLFNTYANFAAIGVVNARLYESEKGYAHELENRVTELKQVEKALRSSEEKFRSIVDFAPNGVFVADRDGNFFEANSAASKISGYSKEELISMNRADLIAPQAHKTARNHFNNVINEGYSSMEIEIVRKDGSKGIWIIDAVRLSDDRFLGFVVDITKRKQAEELIVLSENKYRDLTEQLPLCVVQTDLEGKLTFANKAAFDTFGYSISDFQKGINIFQILDPNDIERARQNVQNSLSGIEHSSHEYRVLRKDGATTPTLIQTNAILENGKPVGLRGYMVDLTDSKKAEEELIKAKEKAEESDRLKSAFLANMSHEIRTPMNGILGFSNLLKEHDLSGEEQQNYINIIEKSGLRMLNIINDIIDISKIEAGLMNLEISESNLNEQMEYIYTFFKPEAENKGIKLLLKNSLPLEEAIIRTDREKVFAIFTNLVKNAIKYTEKGSIEFGYVSTGSSSKSNEQEFYVKDTGIGIAKDRQEAIFERFIQADISDTMARHGAGIGLSITKAFVEMLGGKIRVESEVGIGSTFYFTLPYRGKQKEKNSLKKDLPSEISDNHVNKLNIIIAEDDEVSEMILSINIKELCNTVIKVRTGVEAVEACRKNPDIALILMDIQMPEMNGYEATRQIRKFNKEVIIIAQTAYGLAGDNQRAIEAGCNDYIAKPIVKEKLSALIQKYCIK